MSDIYSSPWHRLKKSAEERHVGIIPLFFRFLFVQTFLPLLASASPHAVATFIHRLRGVKMGRDVNISRTAVIDDSFPEYITIGKGTRISHQSVVVAHTSGPLHLKEKGRLPFVLKPVHIGNYVYVGAHAVILPGVTIGDRAIIAAGSVVTGDVPPDTMVAGVPAVIKREYTD